MENIDPRNSGMSPVCTPPILQRDGAVNNNNPGIATVDISPSSNRNAPLAGKKIFMHYESTGVTVIRNLEMVLRKLQAELVPFFSRDVHYVVTTRPASRLPPPKASSLGAQLAKKTPTGTRQAQLTTGRLSESINRSHTLVGSRGRAMLLAAAQRQPPLHSVSPSQASSVIRQLQTENAVGQSEANPRESTKTDLAAAEKPTLCTSGIDLLSRARQLGIKILTVDMVLKWIHHLPPDIQHYIQSSTLHVDALREELAANDVTHDPERDRLYNVRALATPCIKVLNLTGDYRPLFLDHIKYTPSLWRLLQVPPEGTRSEASICLKSAQASVGGGSWASRQQQQQVPTTGAAAAPMGTSLGLAGTDQTQDTTNVGTTTTAINNTNNPVFRQHSRLEAQAPAVGAPLASSKSMLLLLQRGNRRCVKVRPRRLRRSVTTPVFNSLGGRQTPLKGNEAEEPSGYCECCAINFKNLAEHLTCEDHRHFAENIEHYRSLDTILDRVPGPQVFLKAEQQRRRRQEQLRWQPKLPAVVLQPSGKCSGSATTGQILAAGKSVEGTPETCPPETRSGNDLPVPLVATVQPRASAKPIDDLPRQLPAPPALNTPAAPSSVPRLLLFSSSSSGGGGSGGCSANDGGLPLISVPQPNTVQKTELQVPPTDPAARHLTGHVMDVVDLDVQPAQSGDGRVAWQTVCDQVYTGDCHPSTSNGTPSNFSGTPALEVFHRACPRCSRVHIPTRRSRKLQLQSFTLLGPDHDTCSGVPEKVPNVGRATRLGDEGCPSPAPIRQKEERGAGGSPGAPVLPLTSISDAFSFLLPVRSSNGCSPTDNQPSRPASTHSEGIAPNKPASVMKQLIEWSSFDPSTCPPTWTAGSSRRTRTKGVGRQARPKEGQLVRRRRDRIHAPASKPEEQADGGCGTPSPVRWPSTRRQSPSKSPFVVRSRPTTCRNAARVARESISLSIKALFSPGALDAEIANAGGGRQEGRRARVCRSEAHARLLLQPSNPESPPTPLPLASTPPS